MSPGNEESGWLENLKALSFPEHANRRLHALMGRNNEGLLEVAGRRELELLVAISEDLSLIRASAIELLRLQSREKSP
jgi:hypothetical protein